MKFEKLPIKHRKVVADFISGENWRLPDDKHKSLWRTTKYMDMLDVYWRPEGSEWHQREGLMQKTAQLVMEQRASDYFLHDFVVLEYFEAISAEKIDTDLLESICFYLLTERKG